MIKNVEARSNFSGFKILNNDMSVLNLQYADDTLIFCGTEVAQMSNIAIFLNCCEAALGLKVNFSKTSIIGINCDELVLKDLAEVMNCRVESFLIIYLGLPISDRSLPILV
ncbi:hypothetical protein AMTRI_Chr01g108280 [Amborella trichopoda]